jgi:hypothetical protein
MGKAEQRAKDAAMAARLRDEEGHPRKVAARKASRFAVFMAQFDPKRQGSAKQQRRTR